MVRKKIWETGTIVRVTGHPMSGLYQLHFKERPSCHIESGFGMRQLVNCFGDYPDIFGKKIRFKRDDYNVLEYFEPL